VSIQVIAYILAGLGAVVVVLTRVRLRSEAAAAGRAQVSTVVVNTHTLLGVVGLITWVVYLVTPGESGAAQPVVGIVALACLWVVALCGLLILMRWLPTHGRHASEAVEDSWSDGPGLSVLAHVGMFVAIAIDTLAYMLGSL